MMLREAALAQITYGMSEQKKKQYHIAEQIVRREYEKAFNYNLDLSIGHKQNMIKFTSVEELQEDIKTKIKFWMSLRDRYINDKKHPLKEAIVYFSNVQVNGMINILTSI